VKVIYREKTDGPPVLAGITELLCVDTKQEADQMERRAGAVP
jgi:hypothetical protein